jgi:hypothetical protein
MASGGEQPEVRTINLPDLSPKTVKVATDATKDDPTVAQKWERPASGNGGA